MHYHTSVLAPQLNPAPHSVRPTTEIATASRGQTSRVECHRALRPLNPEFLHAIAERVRMQPKHFGRVAAPVDAPATPPERILDVLTLHFLERAGVADRRHMLRQRC